MKMTWFQAERNCVQKVYYSEKHPLAQQGAQHRGTRCILPDTRSEYHAGKYPEGAVAQPVLFHPKF